MADDGTNHDSRFTIHESSVTLVTLDRVHLARTRGWANDPEIMRLMNRQRLVSESEHEAWFESIRQRDDCAYFAVETSEPAAHVGNVWLWAIEPRHRKAELRIVIANRQREAKVLAPKRSTCCPVMGSSAWACIAFTHTCWRLIRRLGALRAIGFHLEGPARRPGRREFHRRTVGQVSRDMLHVIYDDQCGFCIGC